MNHVVLLRVLLVLAVLLSIIAGSIDALLPQAIPEAGREAFHALQASRNAATGPLFVGLAAAYEIIVLAAAGIASMVTSASTVNVARTATPATG